MIQFKCNKCKSQVLVFIDDGCICGSKDISKLEFETSKNWVLWWNKKGSKDRDAYYSARKPK